MAKKLPSVLLSEAFGPLTKNPRPIHQAAAQAAVEDLARRSGDPVAYARKLWADAMAANSRGLVVTPCPMRLVLPHGDTYEITLPALLRANRDSEITTAVLAEVEHGLDGAELRSMRKRFKGWSYGSMCPPSTSVAFDMPNPRRYSLPDGMEQPTYLGNLDNLPNRFRQALARLWQTGPKNDRSAVVSAFLTHHLQNGGNRVAFLELVEELVEVGIDVENRALLIKRLGEWLANARKGSKGGKDKNEGALLPLSKRFPSEAHYRHFLAKLKECGLLDDAAIYMPSKDGKGRMLGAYEGAAKKLSMSLGNDHDRITTLNLAFTKLKISQARPQDLRGTPGHTAMHEQFESMRWPAHSSDTSAMR